MNRDDGETVLVVRRTIAAPRERVFAAWLDPSSLARWMAPGTVVRADVEVDARVGGRFRIIMRRTDGDDVDHRGEYLAIEPPSRLSFTWISKNTDHLPTVVTVELHDRDGATELVLTHRRLPASQIDPHTQGWTAIVQKLDAVLTAGHRS